MLSSHTAKCEKSPICSQLDHIIIRRATKSANSRAYQKHFCFNASFRQRLRIHNIPQKMAKYGQNPEKMLPDWMVLLDKQEPETPMVLTILFFSIFSSRCLKKCIFSDYIKPKVENAKLTANQHFEGNKQLGILKMQRL